MANFLIGDAARFDSDTLSLTNVAEPEHVIPLGAAAGRCLLVLVQAEGGIVTKRTLLTEAWEQYGAVVTSNNLSQAIVQIRRALQLAGADPALLATVPRIGYRLNQTDKISRFVDASTAPSVMPVSPVLPMPHLGEEIAQTEDEDLTDFLASTPREFPGVPPIAPSIAAPAVSVSPSASTRDLPPTVADTPVESDKRASNPEARPGALPPEFSSAPPSTFPPTLPGAREATSPRNTVRWGIAAGLWAVVALLSAAAATYVTPKLRAGMHNVTSAAVWQPVPGDDTKRFFVTADRAQDTAYVARRLAMLKHEPPVSVDNVDTRFVYVNGTVHDDLFSYLLCEGPVESDFPDCMSYLITPPANAKGSS
ncbi:transcriptional regulator [Pandoraea anhela]|uniref:OmpR/PhoB-type domain-containing protein n=1 Tax=Pandoraea anhela TaxID=2508295 RepID=A0A5E4T6R9_9BURK|nr:winged helix-turn-helix domain-containing protein [Pandoraea anhela]VVD83525.1 hypothetical protein PAN31108_01235 [Pandoraea anhela]